MGLPCCSFGEAPVPTSSAGSLWEVEDGMSIDRRPFKFQTLRGRVALVVNTACK